jgi:NAD(P)H-quinone oxidoreductase subunit 5
MITSMLWLAILGPALLLLLGLIPAAAANRSARPLAKAAPMVALATLASAIVLAVVVFTTGKMHTPMPPLGFGLWADRLTAVMFVLVAFVGTIVVSYSRNYLDGDADHGRFTKWLCFTLASVLVLILSGNMVQFALAWLATSLGLNRLLLFYRGRPAAILAARKKFIASRLSDVCLLGAMWLIYKAFGGLDYATIFAGAAGATATAGLTLACFLLVIAALLKSAQFPLHGWLIEVMETPTPVSALLHAGIINAGGFILLRFSDVLVLSAPALDTLAIVGGFTALFGSVVMLTQSSVKVALAWSTIAQMGFMMLQCGLGAWSAALLHIVAHSLYKAHAFLSSGSVVDLARASWSPSPGGAPHPARLGMALGLVFAVALLASTLFGATLAAQPGVFALGAIMMFGLAHLIAQSIDERPNAFVVVRTLALASVVALAYFGLQFAAARLMAGTLPITAQARGPLTIAIVVVVVLAFAIVTLLQSRLGDANRTPRGRALYAHVNNGFYVNTIANRLVLRLWPAGAPTV